MKETRSIPGQRDIFLSACVQWLKFQGTTNNNCQLFENKVESEKELMKVSTSKWWHEKERRKISSPYQQTKVGIYVSDRTH